MCLCIPTRIILFGNCPSCRGHCYADDALGWQHWRLLLVLIGVFLITELSLSQLLLSAAPESGRGLLAGAGEVAAGGRCPWGLLCSLGPL